MNIEEVNVIQKVEDPKFERTAAWLSACGKQPGNVDQASVQVGVHLEEFTEFLRELSLTSKTGITIVALQEVAFHLQACAEVLKQGLATVEIHDRAAALDALCDLDVTGNGVAYLFAMDKPLGDLRTLNSNDSKFNADGTPAILEGGKIGKGPHYVRAEYADLV